MTDVPHLPYSRDLVLGSLLLFPQVLVKMKLEGYHFDINEVTDAESKAVLSTLTEHVFQDAFKNCRSSGNGAYARKVTTKFVFDQMAVCLGNYG
jgi:hypothetical protein